MEKLQISFLYQKKLRSNTVWRHHNKPLHGQASKPDTSNKQYEMSQLLLVF